MRRCKLPALDGSLEAEYVPEYWEVSFFRHHGVLEERIIYTLDQEIVFNGIDQNPHTLEIYLAKPLNILFKRLFCSYTL